MARLIDADKLTEKLLHFACRLEDWNRPEQAEAVRAVAKGIKLEKTVDAVEVVHGRWEDEFGGKFANPRYRCSVCKEKALYKFKQDDLGAWKEEQAQTQICPFCGAVLGGMASDI